MITIMRHVDRSPLLTSDIRLFSYISKDLAFRIRANSIVRSDEWLCCRFARRTSTKDMIGHHCDGWIELIGVIRRDCNVLQSKLRLLRRPSVEQGWSTGSAGVRDSSTRSGVHDCTYPPHRSTCDQCRYFPSCTRGPPWISLFVAAKYRFFSRFRTLQTKKYVKRQVSF